MTFLVGARLRAMLCVVGMSIAATTHAEAPRDGWASWQIESANPQRQLCCGTISHGDQRIVQGACDLDSDREGFNVTTNAAPNAALRIYAHYRDGRVDDVRAYSADCPVRAAKPVVDLGRRDTGLSLQAITPTREPDGRHRDSVLAAISLHATPRAFDQLATWALRGAADELRKQSMFWLAQTADARAESTLATVLAQERDGDVREQAIFALSQLPAARATPALVKLVDDRRHPREDRKRALFWLAQSDDDAAYRYLDARLTAALR